LIFQAIALARRAGARNLTRRWPREHDSRARARYGRAMLEDAPLIAFVTVTDATRARHFYCNLLGLELISETPFALEFDCAGTMLRVALANHAAAAPYTVLGWRVADIRATVEAIGNAGVRIETFEGLDQSEDGVWRSPSGAQVAWFKDPDGNLLSVTEF
jgi:catechol 2,3-dioxygenase-like lactoylglutathione lyase family enzyme